MTVEESKSGYFWGGHSIERVRFLGYVLLSLNEKKGSPTSLRCSIHSKNTKTPQDKCYLSCYFCWLNTLCIGCINPKQSMIVSVTHFCSVFVLLLNNNCVCIFLQRSDPLIEVTSGCLHIVPLEDVTYGE